MKREMAHATESPVSSRFFTSSNLLSILRALLVIPFVAVMVSGLPSARLWGCIIILLAALTDKLDGMLARRFNEITEWGKILDPLADKIGVAAVALVLLWLGDIPFWFVLALIIRDLLIFAGGMFVKARYWTIAAVSIALFAGVLALPSPWLDMLVIASTLMLVLSLASYAARFIELVKGGPEGSDGNS